MDRVGDGMASLQLYDLLVFSAVNAIAGPLGAVARLGGRLLANLLFRKNVYRSHRHRELAHRALERVEREVWLCESRAVHQNRLVPQGWVLGRRFALVAHVEHPDDFRDRLVVTLFTWWWQGADGGGGCSGGERGGGGPNASAATDVIQVMRHGSCKLDEVDYVRSEELACPLRCPTREASAAAAAQMQAAWERDGQGRFLLQGSPGCGKSTAARLLTRALGHAALLFPSFDPTAPGESLSDMLRYVDRDSLVVVVVEEFDVALTRMLDRPVRAHKNMRIEVSDKASWNNMLDAVQFQPRLLLLLTTNQTDDALRRLDDALGGGLLRPGRITGWIRFNAGSGPVAAAPPPPSTAPLAGGGEEPRPATTSAIDKKLA